MASARAERSRAVAVAVASLVQVITTGSYNRRNRPRIRRKGTNTAAKPRKERVQLELPCTVRSFCESSGVTMSDRDEDVDGHGNDAQHQCRD